MGVDPVSSIDGNHRMKKLCIQSTGLILTLLSACSSVYAYDKYNVGGYWADKRGDTNKAIELWKKAVELHEAKNDHQLPLHYDNLAGVYEEVKKWSDAVTYRKKAGDRWEAEGKFNLAGISIYWAGYDQYTQGQYLESEESFKRSIELLTKAKNVEYWLFNTIRWLGWSQFQQHHYDDALKSVQECLTMRRVYLKGKTNVLLAYDLDLQSQIQEALGKGADAEKSMREAIPIFEAKEPKSISLHSLYYYLAGHLCVQGKNAEAETILKKAVALVENQKDNTDWQAVILYRLGLVYHAQSKFADAETTYNRAIQLYESLGSKCSGDTAQVYQSLVTMLFEQKKPLDAAEAVNKFVASAEKTPGFNALTLAASLNSFGDFYSNQKKYEQAALYYSKCRELRSQKLSPNDPLVLAASRALANVQSPSPLTQAGGTSGSTLTVPKITLQLPSWGPTTPLPSSPPPPPETQSPKLPEEDTGSVGVSGTKPATSPQNTPASPQDTLSLRQNTPSSQQNTTSQSSVNRPIKDKWALVIGISEFAHPEYKLNFAAKDASDFKEFLVGECQFQSDHVKFLRDKQATRQNIMSAFGDTWLPRVVMPDDLVVIYISTHGTPSTRDAGSKNYIVAYDTVFEELFGTGVNMNDLCSQIKERVKTDRVLIVMDTCYSGAAASGARGIGREADNFDANVIAQGAGRLVISSSSPNERSWESPDYKNGIFTYNLIKALRKKSDVVSAFEDMKRSVLWEAQSNYGVAQTPVLGGNWKGINLMLSAPPSEPRVLPGALR